MYMPFSYILFWSARWCFVLNCSRHALNWKWLIRFSTENQEIQLVCVCSLYNTWTYCDTIRPANWPASRRFSQQWTSFISKYFDLLQSLVMAYLDKGGNSKSVIGKQARWPLEHTFNKTAFNLLNMWLLEHLQASCSQYNLWIDSNLISVVKLSWWKWWQMMIDVITARQSWFSGLSEVGRSGVWSILQILWHSERSADLEKSNEMEHSAK